MTGSAGGGTDDILTVVNWNLFHGQDGARLGPTIGSTLFRRGRDDGTRIHLNRKWISEMASVIRRLHPTFAALQEVPPLAVETLAAETGMVAAHSLMPPLVGTTRMRGRLAHRNPDLWRTHEGTANVVLVAAPWQIRPGSSWTVRHNPPPFVGRHSNRLGLARREAIHWLLEPRRLVAVRAVDPLGRSVTVVSLHCHDAADPTVVALEVARVLPRVLDRVPADEALLLAGDFNARGADHPAFAEVARFGLEEPTRAELDIDHVFHRNLAVLEPPRTLPGAIREHAVTYRGRQRIVLLSDHDIIEARYRLIRSEA